MEEQERSPASIQLMGYSRSQVRFIDIFPTLEISFLFSMKISSHAQSVPLDFSGNGSGGFRGFGLLWRPLTVMQQSQFLPSSQPYSCTCIVLCYLQETEQGHLFWESAALPPCGPYSSHILSFLHHVLTNNPWLAPQPPALSGLDMTITLPSRLQ